MRNAIEVTDVRSQYDVVVVGAGPAGCGAAGCFARRGATVLLVESNPNAARRFAGEWIHPQGAKILNDLGILEGLPTHVPALGFAVFPNDGLGAIQLEYRDHERGFACEHETLVAHLRRGVSASKQVDYVVNARAQIADDGTVRLEGKSDSATVRGGRVVVASGRSSNAAALGRGATQEKVSISSMAGLLIPDCKLPFEGYGHVIVGGPGPALAYRISGDRVRLCVDVPHGLRPGGREALEWIRTSFAEVLPPPIRNGIERHLPEVSLSWAANVFRPRRYHTESGVALVGDAAGVFHPLTAMGITMSLLDAEALADARDLDEYATRRASDTYIPELLSNAIYQAFARTDAGSLAIRESIFRTWRQSTAQRTRTMALLGASTTGRTDFVRAFSRVALHAGAGVLRSEPATILDLVGWLRWPLASLHPKREVMRARSVSWASPESWAPAPSETREIRHVN